MDETEAIRVKTGYSRGARSRRSARSACCARSLGEEILFAVGILALGVTLMGPVARGAAKEEKFIRREAVAVMQVSSDAVSDTGAREILAEPDRYAALAEDWSVFDEIGTFFARLIRGE